jgi:hypothetical protein
MRRESNGRTDRGSSRPWSQKECLIAKLIWGRCCGGRTRFRRWGRRRFTRRRQGRFIRRVGCGGDCRGRGGLTRRTGRTGSRRTARGHGPRRSNGVPRERKDEPLARNPFAVGVSGLAVGRKMVELMTVESELRGAVGTLEGSYQRNINATRNGRCTPRRQRRLSLRTRRIARTRRR